MPILFRCSCGKVMQAKEEHAGSRCKCVGCGAMLQIPAASAAATLATPAPKPVAPKPAPPAAAPSSASTHASAKPTAAEATVGPSTSALEANTISSQVSPLPARPKASHGEAVDTIPYPAPAPTPVPPPPPPPADLPNVHYRGTPPPVPAMAVRQDDWMRDDSAGADTAWYEAAPLQFRRRRRRNVILFASLGFLLLAGLALGVWLLLRNPSPVDPKKDKDDAPPGLAHFEMVPRDAPFFFSVRVADLWNSKPLEKARAEWGNKADDFLSRAMGIRISDIERMTVVLADVPDVNPRHAPIPNFWIILHMKAAFNADAVRLRVAPGALVRDVAGKKIYTNADMAFHFPNDKEIWAGKESAIEDLLSGRKKPAMEGPLKDAILLAAKNKHHLVTAVHLPPAFRAELERLPDFPALAKPFMELTSAQAAFNADPGGEFEARLKFKREDAARDAAKVIWVGLGGAQDELKKLRATAPAHALNLIDHASKVLNAAKVEDKGTDVVITLPGASESLGTLLIAALPIFEAEFGADIKPPKFK